MANNIPTGMNAAGNFTILGSTDTLAAPGPITTSFAGSSSNAQAALGFAILGSIAGNFYSMGIQKSGTDEFYMGINKSSTTNSIPASACFITSYLTNSQITIGRGNGAGQPSNADILIGTTGNVTIANGLSFNGTNAVGTLFTQTNTVSYTGTTQTNILGTGIGTTTLPANLLIVGRKIRLKLRGVYSTAALSPSFAITVQLGGVTIATASITALLSSASNFGFSGELEFTCRTAGASGTVITDGSIGFASAAVLGSPNIVYLNNGTTPTTINTTQTNALTILATWGATGSTINVNEVSIEILN